MKKWGEIDESFEKAKQVKIKHYPVTATVARLMFFFAVLGFVGGSLTAGLTFSASVQQGCWLMLGTIFLTLSCLLSREGIILMVDLTQAAQASAVLQKEEVELLQRRLPSARR